MVAVLNSQAEDRCSARDHPWRAHHHAGRQLPARQAGPRAAHHQASIIKGSVEASARTSSPEIALPEIGDDDLAAITRAADEERAKEAAAQKEAEDRAKDFAGKQKEIEEKNEEERKRQKKQARLDRWLDEAKRDEAPVGSPRRPGVLDRRGLQTSPSRPTVRPSRTWASASDGGVPRLPRPERGPTEQQWGLAHLCRKYYARSADARRRRLKVLTFP